MAEKFTSNDSEIEFSQCIFCKHWLFKPGPYCKAFPDGIPDEILDNKVAHTKPYKGDNGIQFERRVSK